MSFYGGFYWLLLGPQMLCGHGLVPTKTEDNHINNYVSGKALTRILGKMCVHVSVLFGFRPSTDA